LKFSTFEVNARPFFSNAYCKCGATLREVSNGLMSVLLFCPQCERAYEPKLIEIPVKKINGKWLEQARKEAE